MHTQLKSVGNATKSSNPCILQVVLFFIICNIPVIGESARTWCCAGLRSGRSHLYDVCNRTVADSNIRPHEGAILPSAYQDMVHGSSRRRPSNGIPGIVRGHQRKQNGSTHHHPSAPTASTCKMDTSLPSVENAAIAHLRGRERGPWGGNKFWLDMGVNQKLNRNISTRCRLLLARRYWENTRMLRAPIQEEFFPSSYRYRGHEGCVNAIKFHPTEPWLCSGGDDLRLLFWEPRAWPRTPKTAIRTEHSDNIFCIDFDTLGGHALTAANDGLVTRIALGSSPTSETRDFHSLYRRLQAPRVEEMRSLSLPLTHPDSTPAVPVVTAAPVTSGADVTGSSIDGLGATDDDLLFFHRGRIRACFEAKFVDTAGQIAAAALELGFVALADFRERPEVTHPVMRDGGDFTSVDPHLPLPFQLAYAGSCGAGILDLRTAVPLLRLRAPGAIEKGAPDEGEKCRGWSISSGRQHWSQGSSSSTGSDTQTRPVANIEIILRLRERFGIYSSGGESNSSSSPEGPAPCTAVVLPGVREASEARCSLRSSSSSSRSSSQEDGARSERSVSWFRHERVARTAATPPGRGKRRCIRRTTRQQQETENNSQSSSSHASGCTLVTEPPRHSSSMRQQDIAPRTRLQHAVAATASTASPSSPQVRQVTRRPRGSRAKRRGRAQRRREQQQREQQQRQSRTAAVTATPALSHIRALRRQGREATPASPPMGTIEPAGRPRDPQRPPTTPGIASRTVRQRATSTAHAEDQPSDGEERCGGVASRHSSAHTGASAESAPPQKSGGPAEVPAGSERRQGSRRQRRSSGGELQAAPSTEAAEGENGPASVRPVTEGAFTRRTRRVESQFRRDLTDEQRVALQVSETVREMLREAEGIAAQLPPIRYPTYRPVPSRTGDRKPCETKEIGDVPLVEMVDKIVFSWDGRLLLAIRRRKEPLIYSTDWELPLFELRSEGYINFNTMKGGCFLTDGRHVACGSENLKVHLWRLPFPLPRKPTATRPLTRIGLLHGHLCVVNCCTSPAPQSPLGLWGPPMLATSGVEKMVRVWSWERPRDKDDCNNYPLDGRFVTQESTEDFLTIARFNRATPPVEMLHEVRGAHPYADDWFPARYQVEEMDRRSDDSEDHIY